MTRFISLFSRFRLDLPFLLRRTVLFAAFYCLAASRAWAHASLDHADPAADSAVTQSPPEVRLTFSEAVEVKFCRVQVFDAVGKQIDNKDAHGDPKKPREMAVSLPASLAAGTYKVVWKAVAADTHTTKGEFAFHVQP